MKKEQYIKEVLREIPISRKMKRRMKEDLEQRIDDAFERDPYYDLVQEMGKPKELAKEFVDNLDDKDKWGTMVSSIQPYEYKTKTTLLGLPLVHIHTGGGYGAARATGIIAVGDIAVGVFTVGGVSIGLVSVGGVGIGLVTLGGVAIGGLALGGVAIGLFALGGVAIGIMKAFGAIPNLLP